MMTDPSASERAYQKLKVDILSGTLPIGPLDIRTLGDRLRMSVTPVREALARLSAERLVKLAPHQGYAVAVTSARQLEHLYAFIGALVDLCLSQASTTTPAAAENTQRRPMLYPEAMADLTREIASSQANLELAEHIFALNDRLFPARRCEPTLFTGAEEEVAAFASLWDSRNYAGLRVVLCAHHALRVERVDALARLLAEQAESL